MDIEKRDTRCEVCESGLLPWKWSGAVEVDVGS